MKPASTLYFERMYFPPTLKPVVALAEFLPSTGPSAAERCFSCEVNASLPSAFRLQKLAQKPSIVTTTRFHVVVQHIGLVLAAFSSDDTPTAGVSFGEEILISGSMISYETFFLARLTLHRLHFVKNPVGRGKFYAFVLYDFISLTFDLSLLRERIGKKNPASIKTWKNVICFGIRHE
jgi:hypothetical protein